MEISFTAKLKKKKTSIATSSTGSSRLSTLGMEEILDKLENSSIRKSTKDSYIKIWRSFNKFTLRLDRIPKWEDRALLYLAFLVENGAQSATIKTYMSAIKNIVRIDKYKWDNDRATITALTQVCRIINDRVAMCLPIQRSLLNLILFEIERLFKNQFYLETLYKVIIALGYYGLFRIGS